MAIRRQTWNYPVPYYAHGQVFTKFENMGDDFNLYSARKIQLRKRMNDALRVSKDARQSKTTRDLAYGRYLYDLGTMKTFEEAESNYRTYAKQQTQYDDLTKEAKERFEFRTAAEEQRRIEATYH